MIDDTKNFIETHEKGRIVYGDTDSVMIQFPGVKTVEEAIVRGKELGPRLSRKLFPHPISLEFEKVYWPYLLISKKRYAGLYWTRPDAFDKLDAKGIELVRRDNCLLAKQTIGKVQNSLMIDKDIEKVKAYIRDVVERLLTNRVDISQLIISKSLSKPPANYMKSGSKRNAA